MSDTAVAERVYVVDILDTLRLRLVDPPASAITDLERRLPGVRAGPADLPLLEVRFVEDLPLGGPLRPIGRSGHADDGDGLVVGRGPGMARPRFRLRFDALPPAARPDGEPTVVCERALGRVPHLVPLVNVALLGLGVLPLHASAVAVGGEGIALAGWRKSGKTEGMLALLGGGAGSRRLIADEWTYVRRDGRLAGLPGPVRLSLSVVEQLGLPPAITGSTTRARVGRAGAAVARRLERSALAPVARIAREAASGLDGLAAVDVPVARLAGPAGVAAEAPLRLLVLLRPVSAGPPRVDEIAAGEVAGRMTAAHVHHRLDLLDLYWTARYASPRATHPVLDDLAARESASLAAVLADVRCIVLEHPLPADVGVIRDALEPVLAGLESPSWPTVHRPQDATGAPSATGDGG